MIFVNEELENETDKLGLSEKITLTPIINLKKVE